MNDSSIFQPCFSNVHASRLGKLPHWVLPVSVMNHQGVPVKGLEKGRLTVFSGKTAQEISFFSDQDEPVSVLFLIDTSGSMRFTGRKEYSLAAAARSPILDFIATGNEANEYAVLNFNAETKLALDWSQDHGQITASLNQLATTEAKRADCILPGLLRRSGFDQAEQASKTRNDHPERW